MKTLVNRLLKLYGSAQSDESQLAPHPHRIRIWGSGPENLAFPSLCPNCGAPATNCLAYSKVFNAMKGRGLRGYVTAVVKVPYCDACIALHHLEVPPPRTLVDLLVRLKAALQPLWTLAIAGCALAVGTGALVLLPRILPMAVSLLLISLLLTAAAFGSYRVAQEGRAFRRAAPQGGITTAFDFSESTSPDDESERFLCTIRNERFAQEFASLNSKHICTASGPSAM